MIRVYVRRILHPSVPSHPAEHDTAWALFYDVLQKEYGRCAQSIQICRTEQGKPYLADHSLFFSLSHTKTLCVLAIGDAEVGVDAELQTRRISSAVRARFLPDLSPDCPPLAVLTAWTAKEAYGKMMGTGVWTAVLGPCYTETLFAYRHVITVCAKAPLEVKEVLAF